MVTIMLPFFFMAMYEKDGLPFEKVGTITTDSNGIAQMGDLPAGKYYVKEVKTAHGYVLDLSLIHIYRKILQQNRLKSR